jgi:acyl-coenzyme A thioesterase PaaI-like protein
VEAALTDMQPSAHRFTELTPMDAPPGLERFVTAVRRLQDLAVSTRPGSAAWVEAAEQLEAVCERLEPHPSPEGVAPAGRIIDLPGLGHPLMPPWTIEEYTAEEVVMHGHFRRFHVGGNMAVHGGVIPLFFDWHFGMIVSAAGRPASRTAYLHVDFRNITPIDRPLVARGRIESIDGRKAFVTARMTDTDGTVLSDANGLMIQLLPHQP